MNFYCRIMVLIGCLLMSVHSSISADEPWSMSRERYACYTSGMTLQELSSTGVTVLSHTPATKAYCDEARRWGIKACPYVSLYKVIDSATGKCSAGENQYSAHTKGLSLLESPFWKELDAAKHPEWFLRREDGAIRRPFDEPDYPACLQQSCCNHQSLIAAYERGVRNVMDLGAGGVFVDNVHPTVKCFGPKLGLHDHDWPEKDNAECYRMALERVHAAVKSYGADRVVILNPGNPNTPYASCGDCVMWESFWWRSGTKDDKPPLVQTRRWEPRTWDKLPAAGEQWKSISIAPLTYLPDPEMEAENAFLAFAAARLAGFEQWTATCAKRRDVLRRLYRVQTGPACSEITASGGAYYRQFENAVVLCNPTDQFVDVRAIAPLSLGDCPVELYDMKSLVVVDGNYSMTLPPQSGRVVVSRQAAFDNLLREVHGQALAARLRLEEAADKSAGFDVIALVKQLKSVESVAAVLRENVGDAGFPSPDDKNRLAELQQTAVAITIPADKDKFLNERLNNLRRHTELAASLCKD